MFAANAQNMLWAHIIEYAYWLNIFAIMHAHTYDENHNNNHNSDNKIITINIDIRYV